MRRLGSIDFRRRFIGFVGPASLALVFSTGARAGDDRWGWNYCAPPYRPSCVEPDKLREAIGESCKKSVEAYVAAVFRYRTCLAKESERAVREANETIDQVKCLMDKHNCPGAER
jgi:hypothetical protein